MQTMDESPDFQHEISNLEAMLDTLPVAEREVVMERLRKAITATGEQLTAEDENLCDRFAQGEIGIRQVQAHFGDRLWRAFGIRPEPGDAPGPSSGPPANDPVNPDRRS
jgi:hypothetical protein